MLVLGIILLLVVLGVSVGVLVGGGGRPSVDLGALHVTTTTAAVFLTGAVTVVLLLLALWLVLRGTRRANQHRQNRKELDRLTRERAAARTTGATSSTATGTEEAADHPGPSATDELPETGGASGTTESEVGRGSQDVGGDGTVTDPDRHRP